MKRRTVLVMVAAAMFSLLSFFGASDASAGAATDVVKTKQTALFELMKKKESADTKRQVQAMFDEMLDYATLAEASLGTEWAARSDAEKAEFSELLKQLVRKAYEKNLRKTLPFEIQYTGEKPAGSAVVVLTRAVSKTNTREEPIEIDFKMADKSGAWRVQDIVTEGASLVSSYRSQFTRVVKKDGFPALIKKMKDKIAKGDVGS